MQQVVCAADFNGTSLSVGGAQQYGSVRITTDQGTQWTVEASGNNANLTVDKALTVGYTDNPGQNADMVVGVAALDGGKIKIGDGIHVDIHSSSTQTTEDSLARTGLTAQDGGSIDLGKDSSVTINTAIDEGNINGAYLWNGGTLTGGDLSMQLDNESNYTAGIYSEGTESNQVTLDSLTIGAKSASISDGIFNGDSLTVTTDKLDVDVTADNVATAISIQGSGTTTIGGVKTILKATAGDVAGSSANGINVSAYDDGKSVLTFSDLEITTRGSHANGIYLSVDPAGSARLTADSLKIDGLATDGTAIGIELSENASVEVGSKLDIVSTGGQAQGIKLDGGTLKTTGLASISVHGTTFSSVLEARDATSLADFYNRAVLIAEADTGSAYGIYQMDGTVNFHNGLTVKAIGGTIDNAAINSLGGNLTVDNGLDASGKFYGIYAVGDYVPPAVININQTGGDTRIVGERYAVAALWNATVNIGGDSTKIDGNILAAGFSGKNVGTINLALNSADSYLTGRVSNKAYSGSVTDGVIHLSLNNGATWNVTGNSSLDTLVNDGKIDLTKDGNGYSTVTVGDLKGNGTVRMDVNVDGQQSDLLKVTGGTGVTSHTLALASSGTASLPRSTALVNAAAGTGAGFSLVNTMMGAKIDMGNYLYELVSETQGDGSTSWLLNRTSELSPSVLGVAALAGSGGQTAQYLDNLSDLYNRLGEVRYGAKDGLWASATGRKDRIGGLAGSSMKQSLYGMHIGYDRTMNSWLLGGSFSAAIADQRGGVHDTAEGDVDTQGINLYATWMGDKGYYADVVFSMDRYHQEITTKMLDGQKSKGSYSAFGVGLSGEVGRRFDLGADKGVFIEPQAQLSYYRAKGKDFTMSGGMKVGQDDMDSLTGRFGVLMGKKFMQKDETYAQVYFKGGFNYEFMGKQKLFINGEKFSGEVLGMRAYYGLGMDWQVSKNTRLWAQLEREEGHNYTKEIEATVGMKYQF